METSVNALAAVADNGFKFEPSNFTSNLSYMGLGMLGIFVVIGVIMLFTAVLNKFSKK